jgi:molybdate transport system ATP-binding protein
VLSVAVRKTRGSFLLDARFEMPTPGVVALFGRSGCGKSTLIDIVSGLLEPDSASIRLDDRVLSDTANQVRVAPEDRRIGYVFQDARLFPHLNVAANLRYALKRARGTHFVSFDQIVALLGLGELMTHRTTQLSGGERQRVAIGRALLSQPKLLLLDEPLAAIDAARREEVLPYLESLRDQVAIPMVYVSHQFDEVLRLATHLVLMDAGMVVAQGDIGEMSVHPQLRAIIGPEAIGAIVDGEVLGSEPDGLTRVRVGQGELKVRAPALESGRSLPAGSKLRVQILARDVIVATEAPANLSVRNIFRGIITLIVSDDADTDLVSIDVGQTTILARVTKAATRELGLALGQNCWALVKAVSLRGHALPAAGRWK